MPRTVPLLALGLAFACGSSSPDPAPASRDRKASPAETAASPTPGQTTPAADPSTEPPPKIVPPPLPSGATIDPLCAQILAPADVEKLVGMPVTARAAPPGVPGTIACAVDIDVATMKSASAVVDCSSDTPSLDPWRSFFEDAAKRSNGELREVSIGKGGLYVKVAVPGHGFGHQIAFVHDQVPCLVRVNAGMFDDDRVTPLAEHVRSRLTADNRPKK